MAGCVGVVSTRLGVRWGMSQLHGSSVVSNCEEYSTEEYCERVL